MSELLQELETALAEQYEIQGELGEGGMAFVFLARDLKHDRQVAVKVLKPELAANLGAERFLREIRITAKLNHPHILPLFDSGVAGGYLFYVMPFVEGEPLSALIEREKQLGIEDALKYTREVAEALAYAHSHGLVHRDIKPDNIFLSRGHAVVADFGIARAVTEAGAEQLTQTGMAVGTPAYMSPEQAAGETNLDGRTDVYALGCVLYEMLVGDIPFTGPNAMAIMARHSMDMITAPHIMRQAIPPEVEDIVYTCMAKTPADRFRTAQELVEAIEAVERGGAPKLRVSAQMGRMSQQARMSQHHRYSEALTPPDPAWRRAAAPVAAVVVLAGVALGAWQVLAGGGGAPSLPGGTLDPERVAVLYFQDLSADSSLSYLADGVTEGLVTQLRDVRTLDVVSLDGVRPFRRGAAGRDSVARALDAGTLVEGSVEPVGDGVRVTARLVDGESGADVVESRTSLELPVADALQLQDSLVQIVARHLRNRLGDEVRLRQRRAATTSDIAWTLVQRAERLRKDGWDQFLADRTTEGLTAYARAESLLVEAERRDPAWPEPTVLRARLAFGRAQADPARTRDWVAAALAHADSALAKDPRNARALALRGETRFRAARADLADDLREEDRMLDQAERDLEAAVQADPSLAAAYDVLSQLNMYRGDKTDAILNAQRAWNEDAYLDVADDVLARLSVANYDLEQLQDADRWCRIGEQRFPRDPRFGECRLTLMMSGGGAADVERAWTLARNMVRDAPARDSAYYRALGHMLVGGVLARAGLADSADAVLRRGRVAPHVDPDGRITFHEAYARIIMDDEDGAVERLKAYLIANPEQHHGTPGQGDLYWWWRPLRDHPEFDQLTLGG